MDSLVEHRQRIPVPGHRRIREGDYQIDGHVVRITRDSLGRAWWQCACGRRCRFLYHPGLTCRRCARLDWASRRRPQLSIAYKIMRWRRMIGQDPTPCSPMVRRPRDRDRVHKIMRRIMAAEDELIDNLHSVNAGLARRVLRQMPRAKADPLNSVRDKRA